VKGAQEQIHETTRERGWRWGWDARATGRILKGQPLQLLGRNNLESQLSEVNFPASFILYTLSDLGKALKSLGYISVASTGVRK
jgi:hypothetical protein